MSLRRFSLKSKLALGATALAITLIGIVSAVQVHFLRQDIGAGIAAQQYALVSQVAHDLDTRLAASLEALNRTAMEAPADAFADPDSFRKHFAVHRELLSMFDDVLLLGVDGRVLSDFPAVAGRIGIDVSDREYFQQTMQTHRPVISRPLRGKSKGEPAVFMAAPILAADGEVHAVLQGVIQLSRDNLVGHLATDKVGDTGYFMVFARGAQPVYVMHPDKDRLLAAVASGTTSGMKPGLVPAAAQAISGFEGTFEGTDGDGLPALFSYHRLYNTDWTLVGVMPLAEAFAPIDRIVIRTLAIAAIVALLFSGLVWFLASRLFAPLARLVEQMEGLRTSTGGQPLVMHRNADEIGVLAQTFEALMAERDVAERRLLKSARHIRAVTDNVPALICYIDVERRFRFNNASYEKWLGRPLSEITGRTVREVYGDTVYAQLGPPIERAFAGEIAQFEIEFPGRDGRIHCARGTYRPDVDSRGRIGGVYGLVSDVTDRKEAQDSLRAEQARVTRILEGTNAGTWEWNIQTREIRVNDRWIEMLGYTIEEIGPTTIDTWVAMTHPDDVARSAEQLKLHFHSRTHHNAYEARMRHKNGAWLWILFYGSVSSRDAEDRVMWMHGVSIDVTARKRAEEALRVSQDFLRRAGEVAGIGGWQLDLVTNAVTWSDETRRLHGVDSDYRPELATAIDFYTPEGRVMIDAAVADAVAHGTPWDLELPLRSATGRQFWARTAASVEFEDGKPVRLVGAFQDITARKRIEQELVEGRQLLQTTLESIGDAVITTDPDGCIRWLNPVAERMTGWTKAEAAGRPLAQVFVIINEETRTAAPDPVALCISQGKVIGLANRTLLLARDGREYGIEDSASPICDSTGACYGVVLVFHDVSEQRRLSQEMTHRATHDLLTGLVNRTEFEARLERVLGAACDDERGSALMFIDLDRFKIVNDACGHSVGDQLLRQVATLLSTNVRGRDTVGRLGGDEFGVLLEHCSVEQAEAIAQKICDQMEEFRFTHDEQRFSIGTSIGLVPIDVRWTTVATAMQAADASCFLAKEGGRNRVHRWIDTDGAIKARHGEMQWVSRIEQALDENRFELHVQRIESIRDPAAPVHCEILLRLREANGELVLPGAFLPAAERFHLATRIDRWVVREVFARLEDDPAFTRDIGVVAVNLSGHSIGDRAFHRDVTRMIAEARFDVRKLCFEITETAAITNFGDAKVFIDAVRSMGVLIALDDFGAGASSFGYLKSLPVDFLKIDGRFITDLLDDALDDAAVRCFRDVARVVGVTTIAEFVEREDVQDALREIGIDMCQGYLIHRPEPLAALAMAMA